MPAGVGDGWAADHVHPAVRAVRIHRRLTGGEPLAWGGGEPEDPIEAFRVLADLLGLRGARVGLELAP